MKHISRRLAGREKERRDYRRPSIERREYRRPSKERRDYSKPSEERRQRDNWKDRNENEKKRNEIQEGINKREESKKEKFESAVIDYIKDLSTNINNSQEVEKLLKEIMKGVEECFNLVRKEVRKEKDTIHKLQKEENHGKKGAKMKL